MRSILVEIIRSGEPEGSINKGREYLVSVASGRTTRAWQCSLGPDEFRRALRYLRYRQGDPPADIDAARQKLAEAVTAMLALTEPLQKEMEGTQLLQLDVVASSNEIAALPLELLNGPDGNPLLVSGDARIILTRRVRGTFAERRLAIRPVPKVLFVHCDSGGDVPAAEHEAALRAHLEPWARRGAGGFKKLPLQVLENASLEDIREACLVAADEAGGLPPFSHLHLLAHGASIGEDEKKCFGLCLRDPLNNKVRVASPEEIVEALSPLHNKAVTVTMAACDGANEAETIVPARSLAHELHRSGIPLVVASQLPMTIAGSITFVDEYYGAALSGRDVRYALRDVRSALWANRASAYHDWASVVAYVQLPEAYAEDLEEVRLVRELEALKAARSSLDALMVELERAESQARGESMKLLAELDALALRVQTRIANLNQLAKQTNLARRGVYEENLGLLGSAEKRLAELYFNRARVARDASYAQQSRDALLRSLGYYRGAYKRNLSHHWSTVQALSIQAVTGSASQFNVMPAAVAAAETQAGDESESAEARGYAFGSLLELHLVSMLTGGSIELAQSACAALRDLKPLPPSYVFESTAAQLKRYVDWWTKDNGFFTNHANDLSKPAQLLLQQLTAPQPPSI